jgi:soluble cytochrome b562
MRISLPGFAATLLITTFLAASLPVRGQDNGPKSPLAEQMSGISKDYRSLRKIVTDPTQKDTALGLVKDMVDRATKAKGFDPAKAKDVAPADRDQFIADYHKQMDGLIADLQKLEQAITDGKTTDASALLDTLRTDEREGHKKFRVDIDSGPGGPGSGQRGPGGPAGGPPPAAGPAPGSPTQSGT